MFNNGLGAISPEGIAQWGQRISAGEFSPEHIARVTGEPVSVFERFRPAYEAALVRRAAEGGHSISHVARVVGYKPTITTSAPVRTATSVAPMPVTVFPTKKARASFEMPSFIGPTSTSPATTAKSPDLFARSGQADVEAMYYRPSQARLPSPVLRRGHVSKRPFTAVDGKIPGRTLLTRPPLWDRHFKQKIAQMSGGYREVPTFGEVALGQLPAAGQKEATTARSPWGSLFDTVSQGFDLLTEREQTKMARVAAAGLPVPTDAIPSSGVGTSTMGSAVLLAGGAAIVYFVTQKKRRGRRR